jgi:hypothetical protein
MESGLLASETLADKFGVFVYQNAHLLLRRLIQSQELFWKIDMLYYPSNKDR